MILPPCLPIGETISHLVVDASSHLSLVGSGGPKFMAHDLHVKEVFMLSVGTPKGTCRVLILINILGGSVGQLLSGS